MLVRVALIVSGFMFASASALAAEKAAEEEASPWSGRVSFGFLGTSGNTDNSNLNTNFEIGYTAGKWHHQLDAYAINATEDSETTARPDSEFAAGPVILAHRRSGAPIAECSRPRNPGLADIRLATASHSNTGAQQCWYG